MTGMQMLSSNKTISHWSQEDVRDFLDSHFLTRKYRPNLSHWTGSELVGAGDENLASLGVPYFPRKFLLRKVQSLCVAETTARFPDHEPQLRALLSKPQSSSLLKKNSSFASSSLSSSSSSAPSSPSSKRRVIETLQKVKEKFSASSTSTSSLGKENAETVYSLRRFQRVEVRLNTSGSGLGASSGRGSPPSKRHRHSLELTPRPQQDHDHSQANKDLLQHFLKGGDGNLDLSGLCEYINQGVNDDAKHKKHRDQQEELCTFSYYPEEEREKVVDDGRRRKRRSGSDMTGGEKLALASLSTPEELCLWFEQENIAEAVPYLLKNRVTLAQLQGADRTKLRALLAMPEPKWRRLEFLLWSELQPHEAPRSRRIQLS